MAVKKKKIRWNSLNRKVHYWGSIISVIPLLIIVVTGFFLIFKKESDWVQPPTIRGHGKYPTISFERVLEEVKKVKEVEVEGWKDIDRLDVRPKKGVIKIRAKNRWELQIDHQTGEVLHLAYRRSDIIEDIHTGNFFNKIVSLGIFFPSSVILLILIITGMYLFITITIKKGETKKRKLAAKNH